jgi:hypothetical protein
MRMTRTVKVTLGMSVTILAGVVAVTLTRTPPRVLRVGTPANTLFTRISGDGELCQPDETLPAATTAVRLQLPAYFGARVRVTALAGTHVLSDGASGPDWTGSSVTVPIRPLDDAVSHVTLCFTIGPNSEPLDIVGLKTPRREMAVWRGGAPVGGRLSVEDLGSGQGSWWSRILPVARHIGLGRAFSGTWIVLLIATLMVGVGVLALAFVVRELPDE